MSSEVINLNVIVSVVKNRLVCPWDDYRAFLDHITGTHVPLWDIERARAAAATHLIGRTKALKKMPDPPEKTDSGNAAKFVRDCATACGFDTLPVAANRITFTVRLATEAAK